MLKMPDITFWRRQVRTNPFVEEDSNDNLT